MHRRFWDNFVWQKSLKWKKKQEQNIEPAVPAQRPGGLNRLTCLIRLRTEVLYVFDIHCWWGAEKIAPAAVHTSNEWPSTSRHRLLRLTRDQHAPVPACFVLPVITSVDFITVAQHEARHSRLRDRVRLYMSAVGLLHDRIRLYVGLYSCVTRACLRALSVRTWGMQFSRTTRTCYNYKVLIIGWRLT